MFLTWYSPEAIAAAMPAGMLNFCIMSLFIGTVGYVNTFVAQYFGSGKKKPDRTGCLAGPLHFGSGGAWYHAVDSLCGAHLSPRGTTMRPSSGWKWNTSAFFAWGRAP